MHILFRVDASVEIGTGHVMRSLTLADELKKKGASVQFICRNHSGNLCDFLENKGYVVRRLVSDPNRSAQSIKPNSYEHWLGVGWKEDVEQTINILKKSGIQFDWLVVDHYAIDSRWEQMVSNYVNKIMVIDDLANRPHLCDILLDQNLYGNMEERYDGLVPDHCVRLLGPRYALLRSEFRKARKHAKRRDGSIGRILVFFGGSDPTNETAKTLEAIKLLDRNDLTVDVVVGSSNPHKEQIAAMCKNIPDTNFYCQIDFMAELMLKADLAIGAGGSTTWERCSLGLPAITITTAENQIAMTTDLARKGAIMYLGTHRQVSAQYIAEALGKILTTPERLSMMSDISMSLMGNDEEGIQLVIESLWRD